MADDRRELDRIAGDKVEQLLEPQPELMLGLPETAKGMALAERRRAGRPQGARNRRVEDVARWVLDHMGDPLLVQAQVAVMPVAELAAALGCSPMDALAAQRLAAAQVLPYLHQRKPIAVDVSTTKVVHLTIVEGLPGDAPAEDGVTILGTFEIVENQGNRDGEQSEV